MRHRITIQKPSFPHTVGAINESWTTYATVWAEKEDLRGREFWQSAQTNAEITTKFRVRWLRGLQAKWRIIEGIQKYDILSVIDVENRYREMELMTREIVGDYAS